MNFQEKLDARVDKVKSFLCVGLDPVLEKIPPRFRNTSAPFFNFNKHIIDTTHIFVCAYKPNSAFYEAHGAEGIKQLKQTCDYIKLRYPDIPLILDAKRGDIGSSNEAYSQYAFDYLNADALTLHPYLGYESLKPFLEKKDKGFFIMCKNSNPGAGELQDLLVGNKKLYELIAEKVAGEWNKNGNCMLVVGATYPAELRKVREIVGNTTILVPGVGAQGGDIKRVLKEGLNMSKRGLIISVSRDILFAEQSEVMAKKYTLQMSI